MKYRRDKEKKKDEDNGKKLEYKHNKSSKIIDIAKNLEDTLNKNAPNDEKEETPIIQATVTFENNNPQNDIVTLKSNKKKRALKKFEDN